MYKTTITLIVLSEEPIPETMDISDVAGEWVDGDYVLHSTEMTSAELTSAEMSEALWEADSEPGFFGLE